MSVDIDGKGAHSSQLVSLHPMAFRDDSVATSGETLASSSHAVVSSLTGSPMNADRRIRRHNDHQGVTASSLRHGHRSGPHLDGMIGQANVEGRQEEAASSARMMRQRFRQRCQEAMARDRQRDRDRRLREIHRKATGSDVTDQYTDDTRTSDAISSEYGTSTEYGMAAAEEDEEVLRRQMLSEYRALLHEQEQQGRLALGWLGHEELEWLEEEVRREDSQQRFGVSLGEQEPPADMIDEDEDLYEMYRHSQQPTHGMQIERDVQFAGEEDFSWVREEDLLDLDLDMN